MALKDFKTRKDVFKYIARSTIYGNLGLFVGAGLPMAILNEDETIALSWPKLIEECCTKLTLDYNDISTRGLSYPEVASSVCKLYSLTFNIGYQEAVQKFKQAVADLTSWYPEKKKRKEYAEYFNVINPKWVLTTNYDTIIESILTGRGYSISSEDYMVAQKDLIPVYHLHGIRTNPNSIVITQEDYVGLFRPNEYRQQKLPLTIKESLTLLIRYNLGDFNVLTAVDWSNNVYVDKDVTYPQGIIQFLYCETPKNKPYLTHTDITIVEFNDLPYLLKELTDIISAQSLIHRTQITDLQTINNQLIDCDKEMIEKFIDDDAYRQSILNHLKGDDVYIIGGFMELFTRSVEETWERSQPAGAFYAYDDNLKLTLDILITLEIKQIPPVLLEAIVYNLNSLAYYIGPRYGQSRAAKERWKKLRDSIPDEAIEEIKNMASARRYSKVTLLIKNNQY